MTKHKLDQEVEDILQHFGIKGMKWGVKRAEESSSSEDSSGGGGGGEIDESLLEQLGDSFKDALKALDKSLDKVSDSIKKKGAKFLENIFGKSEVKISKAKANSKRTQEIKNAMKAYDKAGPEQRKAMKKGLKVTVSSEVSGKGTKGTSKKVDGWKMKTITDKELNSLRKDLKKKGYKSKKIGPAKSKEEWAKKGWKFDIKK